MGYPTINCAYPKQGVVNMESASTRAVLVPVDGNFLNHAKLAQHELWR